MRILHVGKYFPPHAGGMESYLGDLAAAQTRRGDQVAALVHGCKSAVRQHGGVTVYEARTMGVLNYAPVSPGFAFMLARAVREQRPDCIHVHVPNASAFWMLFSLRVRAIPWVIQWQSDVSVEGGPLRLRLPYQFYRLLERAMLRRASAIICSSENYLRRSKPLRPWRHKARVIPLGVDPDRLAPGPNPIAREAPWSSGADVRVLVTGRLAHYKGHRVLIEALRQTSGVEVAIAGSGELSRPLRQLAKRLELQDRIRFLGHVDSWELNELMARCDVVCLPSTARTESFGVVLLEAMAAGRPVIASDVPGSGMPWVVRTAGHGLLVRPGDSGSLADALVKMKDPELRARLGSAGRQGLDERFHIDRVADRISTIYSAVAGATAT